MYCLCPRPRLPSRTFPCPTHYTNRGGQSDGLDSALRGVLWCQGPKQVLPFSGSCLCAINAFVLKEPWHIMACMLSRKRGKSKPRVGSPWLGYWGASSVIQAHCWGQTTQSLLASSLQPPCSLVPWFGTFPASHNRMYAFSCWPEYHALRTIISPLGTAPYFAYWCHIESSSNLPPFWSYAHHCNHFFLHNIYQHVCTQQLHPLFSESTQISNKGLQGSSNTCSVVGITLSSALSQEALGYGLRSKWWEWQG